MATRGWEPTDYNPNIIRDVSNRTIEEFENDIRFSRDWGFVQSYGLERATQLLGRAPDTRAVEFFNEFMSQYSRAVELMEQLGIKKKILKKFKRYPIAPCLYADLNEECNDVLTGSKIGGIPDQRQAGSALSSRQYC
jgi:hypothetical protein